MQIKWAGLKMQEGKKQLAGRKWGEKNRQRKSEHLDRAVEEVNIQV